MCRYKDLRAEVVVHIFLHKQYRKFALNLLFTHVVFAVDFYIIIKFNLVSQLSRSDGYSGLVVITPERKVRAPQNKVLPNRKMFEYSNNGKCSRKNTAFG